MLNMRHARCCRNLWLTLLSIPYSLCQNRWPKVFWEQKGIEEHVIEFCCHALQWQELSSYFAKKYQEANDYYEEFIKDNIEMEDGQTISANEMYSRFQAWYREATNEKPPKKTDVVEFLERHLSDSYDSKKRRFNNVKFLEEITEF